MAESKKSMMQNGANNMCMNCGACGCCAGMYHGSRHSVGRWVLGIIVILLVFSFGMKLGELKAIISGQAGWGGNDFGGPHFRAVAPKMMYWSEGQNVMMQTEGNATKTTATPTTTKK